MNRLLSALRFPLFALLAALVVASAKPDLSRVTDADIAATVKHLQALVQEADARAESAERKSGTLAAKVIELESNQLAGQQALETAAGETARVQGILDAEKLRIAALETKLSKWRKFGGVMLAVIAAVVFVFAFQLLGRLPFIAAGPYAWLLRLGLSGAAATTASGLVWRFVTRML